MYDRYLGFMSGTYTGINDEPPMLDCDGNAENYNPDGMCSICSCAKECKAEYDSFVCNEGVEE